MRQLVCVVDYHSNNFECVSEKLVVDHRVLQVMAEVRTSVKRDLIQRGETRGDETCVCKRKRILQVRVCARFGARFEGKALAGPNQ